MHIMAVAVGVMSVMTVIGTWMLLVVDPSASYKIAPPIPGVPKEEDDKRLQLYPLNSPKRICHQGKLPSISKNENGKRDAGQECCKLKTTITQQNPPNERACEREEQRLMRK